MKYFIHVLKFIISFFFLASLSGCLTTFPLEQGGTPANLKKNGLIIGSFEEISDGDLPMSVHVFIKDVISNKNVARISSDDFTEDNKVIQITSTPISRGGVFVMELPPGVYTFNNFNIVTYAASVFTSSKLNFGRIRVKENEAIYIGSFRLFMNPGENAIGLDTFYSSYIEFEDKYNRDMGLARKGFPFLEALEVANKSIKYKTR